MTTTATHYLYNDGKNLGTFWGEVGENIDRSPTNITWYMPKWGFSEKTRLFE
jgi:hypothetical protein